MTKFRFKNSNWLVFQYSFQRRQKTFSSKRRFASLFFEQKKTSSFFCSSISAVNEKKDLYFVEKQTSFSDPIFFNFSFDKGRLKNVVAWFFETYGQYKTLKFLEKLKEFGFTYATMGGISLGIDDLKIPNKKIALISTAETKVSKDLMDYRNAKITGVERMQRLIYIWNQTNDMLKQEVIKYFEGVDLFNPIYMMAFSGARGNMSQVRQLVGMRGLMSDPQGQIIDFPIQSNFREGLTLTEYLISTYGARKGIVDTALRTATAGYLTRRLVDVAQHVIVSQFDCGTQRGIFLFDMKEANKTIYSFQNRLVGRVLAQDIYVQDENKMKKSIALKNQEIDSKLAKVIGKVTKKALVRSPLTCETSRFVCQLCYGWSLSKGKLVSVGEAVGVIAAQSIGEPGTQLTMRTFHTGGVFAGGLTDQILAPFDGKIHYIQNIPGSCIRTALSQMAFLTKLPGSFFVTQNETFDISENFDLKNFQQKQHKLFSEISKIPAYAVLFVRQHEFVQKKQVLAQFSTVTQNQLQYGSAEQTLFSNIAGEVYFTGSSYPIQKNNVFKKMDLLVEKRISESAELSEIELENDIIWKSRNWTNLWILSGKVLPNLLHSDSFMKPGDLLTTRSVLSRILWKKRKFGNFLIPQKQNLFFKKTFFKQAYSKAIADQKNISYSNQSGFFSTFQRKNNSTVLKAKSQKKFVKINQQTWKNFFESKNFSFSSLDFRKFQLFPFHFFKFSPMQIIQSENFLKAKNESLLKNFQKFSNFSTKTLSKRKNKNGSFQRKVSEQNYVRQIFFKYSTFQKKFPSFRISKFPKIFNMFQKFRNIDTLNICYFSQKKRKYFSFSSAQLSNFQRKYSKNTDFFGKKYSYSKKFDFSLQRPKIFAHFEKRSFFNGLSNSPKRRFIGLAKPNHEGIALNKIVFKKTLLAFPYQKVRYKKFGYNFSFLNFFKNKSVGFRQEFCFQTLTTFEQKDFDSMVNPGKRKNPFLLRNSNFFGKNVPTFLNYCFPKNYETQTNGIFTFLLFQNSAKRQKFSKFLCFEKSNFSIIFYSFQDWNAQKQRKDLKKSILFQKKVSFVTLSTFEQISKNFQKNLENQFNSQQFFQNQKYSFIGNLQKPNKSKRHFVGLPAAKSFSNAEFQKQFESITKYQKTFHSQGFSHFELYTDELFWIPQENYVFSYLNFQKFQTRHPSKLQYLSKTCFSHSPSGFGNENLSFSKKDKSKTKSKILKKKSSLRKNSSYPLWYFSNRQGKKKPFFAKLEGIWTFSFFNSQTYCRSFFKTLSFKSSFLPIRQKISFSSPKFSFAKRYFNFSWKVEFRKLKKFSSFLKNSSFQFLSVQSVKNHFRRIQSIEKLSLLKNRKQLLVFFFKQKETNLSFFTFSLKKYHEKKFFHYFQKSCSLIQLVNKKKNGKKHFVNLFQNNESFSQNFSCFPKIAKKSSSFCFTSIPFLRKDASLFCFGDSRFAEGKSQTKINKPNSFSTFGFVQKQTDFVSFMKDEKRKIPLGETGNLKSKMKKLKPFSVLKTEKLNFLFDNSNSNGREKKNFDYCVIKPKFPKTFPNQSTLLNSQSLDNKQVHIKIESGWICFFPSLAFVENFHQLKLHQGHIFHKDFCFEQNNVLLQTIALDCSDSNFHLQTSVMPDFRILKGMKTKVVRFDKEKFLIFSSSKFSRKKRNFSIDSIQQNQKSRFCPQLKSNENLASFSKYCSTLNFSYDFLKRDNSLLGETENSFSYSTKKKLFDPKTVKKRLALFVRPMQYRLLENPRNYKNSFQNQTQKSCLNKSSCVSSLKMYKKYHSNLLNSQKPDISFFTNFLTPDTKIQSEFQKMYFANSQTKNIFSHFSTKIKKISNLPNFSNYQKGHEIRKKVLRKNVFSFRNYSRKNMISKFHNFQVFQHIFSKKLEKIQKVKADFEKTISNAESFEYGFSKLPPHSEYYFSFYSVQFLPLRFSHSSTLFSKLTLRKSQTIPRFHFSITRSSVEFSIFERKSAFFHQRFFQYDRINDENLTFWDKGKNDSSNFLFSKWSIFQRKKQKNKKIDSLFQTFLFQQNQEYFANTKFLSPFDGELVSMYTNESNWWKKASDISTLQQIDNFSSVVTKKDLFSVNFSNRDMEEMNETKNSLVQSSFYSKFESFRLKYAFKTKSKNFQNFSNYLLNQYKNFELLLEKQESSFVEKSKKEKTQVFSFVTKYENKMYTFEKLSIGYPKFSKFPKLGKFLVYGDCLFDFAIRKPGQVVHISNSRITFRISQPFLVSPKGIFHFSNTPYIEKNIPILTLPYQTVQSGDIVQGIPKVEQLFEARTTIQGRLFLSSLPILLKGIFERYKYILPLEQAVRQSFLKIQQLVVDGVQRVYRSQGVSIIDKHLEVIVRQMTTKVQIINGAQTGFFPGELVNLELVERINKFFLGKIRYEPVILGITRASLEVDSFLSASSFQQTTKILSLASISRKKDFLKGLKENILVGNLIPSGTGYLMLNKNF